MALKSVSSEKGGRFILEVGRDTFEVSQSDRAKGEGKNSVDLRAKLRASLGKDVPVVVDYYKDVDGNEYMMTGGLPPVLPNTQRDER